MINASSIIDDAVHFVSQSLDEVIPAFTELMLAYTRRWGAHCLLTDSSGQAVAGEIACLQHCSHTNECMATRRQAIEESVRWGEPAVFLCPRNEMVCAVPVIHNTRVIGGIFATKADGTVTHAESPVASPQEMRLASQDLLAMTVSANLTNPALLELRRLEAERESERAEAIHEVKGQSYQSIREIYLVEEPPLIAAIKRGDRAAAREIINRVLVGIYYLGYDRPLLLKSFLLELVVMMSRSAVEAGGDPSELLGANYSAFAELAQIETEEELCAWLVSMLERTMDAIKANQHYPISVLLGEAMKYMQTHLQDDLSRDDVARVACLSPSHFSRVIKQNFGYSFTELMSRMRVEKARELLVRTEKNLLQICLECGFSEQSYFTKVFQKYTGRPPGEYRRLHRAVR